MSTSVPPPLPAPTRAIWFLGIGNQPVGPLDLEGVTDHLRAAPKPHQVLAWRQGLSGWTACEAVPELSDALALATTPVPPALPNPIERDVNALPDDAQIEGFRLGELRRIVGKACHLSTFLTRTAGQRTR